MDTMEIEGISLILKPKNFEEGIEVDLNLAIMSGFVKNMVTDEDGVYLPITDENKNIPLPNVTKEILELVLKFLYYYRDHNFEDIKKPLVSSKMKDIVKDEWYVEFTKVDNNILFELIMAANYLDIPKLLDLCCAKVATQIKGKTPEQIRARFNIKNDFTPEEEKLVRQENEWCEDTES